MKKDHTLALKARDVGDPITHILFCVNLLYADDNVNVSVTRFQGSDQDIKSIHSGDHNIEENNKFDWKRL